MMNFIDRVAWIGALIALALALDAQELQRADRLTISKANVLQASVVRQQVTTNDALIGKGRVAKVTTNETTVVREFPMMTDILTRSRISRGQDKLNKTNLIGKAVLNGRK